MVSYSLSLGFGVFLAPKGLWLPIEKGLFSTKSVICLFKTDIQNVTYPLSFKSKLNILLLVVDVSAVPWPPF